METLENRVVLSRSVSPRRSNWSPLGFDGAVEFVTKSRAKKYYWKNVLGSRLALGTCLWSSMLRVFSFSLVYIYIYIHIYISMRAAGARCFLGSWLHTEKEIKKTLLIIRKAITKPRSRQRANQPASQPPSQPANQPANQPASQIAKQPAAWPALLASPIIKKTKKTLKKQR